MAPPYIYVAVWTLSDGHTLHTLTDEPSFRRWTENPQTDATKRLNRWNSPNRPPGATRLSKAIGFKIERYEKAPGEPHSRRSYGNARRAAS